MIDILFLYVSTLKLMKFSKMLAIYHFNGLSRAVSMFHGGVVRKSDTNKRMISNILSFMNVGQLDKIIYILNQVLGRYIK